MSRKMLLTLGAAAIAVALSIAAVAQTHQYGHGSGVGGSAAHFNLDLATKTSIEGTVDGLHMGRGMGQPSFTLSKSDGKTVTIVASPYWAVLEANFKIALGDKMSVLAFPTQQYPDTYVATELKNLTNGTVLTLRDDTGAPIGGNGSNCGMCGNCPFGGQGR